MANYVESYKLSILKMTDDCENVFTYECDDEQVEVATKDLYRVYIALLADNYEQLGRRSDGGYLPRTTSPNKRVALIDLVVNQGGKKKRIPMVMMVDPNSNTARSLTDAEAAAFVRMQKNFFAKITVWRSTRALGNLIEALNKERASIGLPPIYLGESAFKRMTIGLIRSQNKPTPKAALSGHLFPDDLPPVNDFNLEYNTAFSDKQTPADTQMEQGSDEEDSGEVEQETATGDNEVIPAGGTLANGQELIPGLTRNERNAINERAALGAAPFEFPEPALEDYDGDEEAMSAEIFLRESEAEAGIAIPRSKKQMDAIARAKTRVAIAQVPAAVPVVVVNPRPIIAKDHGQLVRVNPAVAEPKSSSDSSEEENGQSSIVLLNAHHEPRRYTELHIFRDDGYFNRRHHNVVERAEDARDVPNGTLYDIIPRMRDGSHRFSYWHPKRETPAKDIITPMRLWEERQHLIDDDVEMNVNENNNNENNNEANNDADNDNEDYDGNENGNGGNTEIVERSPTEMKERVKCKVEVVMGKRYESREFIA